ncbi:hypothetical protein, partial [Escherichia coli]|uniref:hypothetical protein n=1 Tax=Escherichia coli TaxID=562 RepID=UPI0012C9652C
RMDDEGRVLAELSAPELRDPLAMAWFADSLWLADYDAPRLLRFDRGLKRYQLQDLKLAGEASGEPLNGKTLTFASQGQLLLDQSAQVA